MGSPGRPLHIASRLGASLDIGAEKVLRLSATTPLPELVRELNESHFIDYQDCDYLAFRKMVCGGIAGLSAPAGPQFELGGLALLDLRSSEIVHEVPVQRYSPATNHVVTRNPVVLERSANGLRLFGAPDDEEGAILIYEASL